MNEQKKVLRNSFIYTASNILLKVFSFFLLPLYTNYLTTEDYGIVSIANSFTSVAIYLIVFSLFSAVFRFYADFKNDADKVERYLGTIVTFSFITNAVFLTVCFLLKDIVSNLLFPGVNFFPIVVLALINTAATSIYTLYQDILKSAQLARKSAITSIIYFVVQLIMCIVFVALRHMGAVGALAAYAGTQLIFVIWALVDLKRMHMFRVCLDISMLKESLKYSIPIIPHNLSTTIAQYLSKLFISGIFSLSTVGLFNLALQFGLIADTVQSSVSSAFQPWFFEQMNKQKDTSTANDNITSMTSLLTWAYCIIFIFIGFFSKEAISIIANSAYFSSWKIIPFIIATYAIKIPYYFYVSVLFYHKEATKKVFLITLSTSFINILLSALFIPGLGMYGSVLADAIAMFIRVLIVIIVAKKYSNISFNLKGMIGKIFYTMALMTLFLIPSYLYSNIEVTTEIAIKIVGIIVYICGLIIFERKNIFLIIKKYKLKKR